MEMRSGSLRLRDIAADFNDLAVLHHKLKNHVSAVCLYESALKAMLAYISRRNDQTDRSIAETTFISSLQKKLSIEKKIAAKQRFHDRIVQSNRTEIHEVNVCASSLVTASQDDILEVISPVPAVYNTGSFPDDDETLTTLILYNAGLMHLQRGDIKQAYTLLRMALPLQDDSVGSVVFGCIQYVLGIIYSLQGRIDDSNEKFMAAFRYTLQYSNPNDVNRSSALLSRIGHILLSRGFDRSAQQVFEGSIILYSKLHAERADLFFPSNDTFASAPAA